MTASIPQGEESFEVVKEFFDTYNLPDDVMFEEKEYEFDDLPETFDELWKVPEPDEEVGEGEDDK